MEIQIGEEPCKCYLGQTFERRLYIGIYYYVGNGRCIPDIDPSQSYFDVFTNFDFIIPIKYANPDFTKIKTMHNSNGWPFKAIDNEVFKAEYKSFSTEMFRRENITDIPSDAESINIILQKLNRQ